METIAYIFVMVAFWGICWKFVICPFLDNEYKNYMEAKRIDADYFEQTERRKDTGRDWQIRG